MQKWKSLMIFSLSCKYNNYMTYNWPNSAFFNFQKNANQVNCRQYSCILFCIDKLEQRTWQRENLSLRRVFLQYEVKNAHGRTCNKTKLYIYLYISLYENLFEKGYIYIYIVCAKENGLHMLIWILYWLQLIGVFVHNAENYDSHCLSNQTFWGLLVLDVSFCKLVCHSVENCSFLILLALVALIFGVILFHLRIWRRCGLRLIA